MLHFLTEFEKIGMLLLINLLLLSVFYIIVNIGVWKKNKFDLEKIQFKDDLKTNNFKFQIEKNEPTPYEAIMYTFFNNFLT